MSAFYDGLNFGIIALMVIFVEFIRSFQKQGVVLWISLPWLQQNQLNNLHNVNNTVNVVVAYKGLECLPNKHSQVLLPCVVYETQKLNKY